MLVRTHVSGQSFMLSRRMVVSRHETIKLWYDAGIFLINSHIKSILDNKQERIKIMVQTGEVSEPEVFLRKPVCHRYYFYYRRLILNQRKILSNITTNIAIN